MITVLAVAAALLAGCSSNAATQPTGGIAVPTTTAAPAKTQTPEEIETDGPRVELPGGLLLKQFGKVAWTTPKGSTDGRWSMRLVVDSVVVDPKCDPYVPASERGHRLLLTLRVETSETWTADLGVPQSSSWSTVGADGVTEGPTSIGYECHQAKAFPSEMRPAAKYRGEVTVDTSNATGQLVLSSLFAWNYPAAA